jgi:light-regulated signal transduction histidine kinase (bacteriophytochrome)
VSLILPNGSFRNSTVGAKVEITVTIEELAEEGDKYRCLATNRAGNASEHNASEHMIIMIRNVKPTAHLSVSSSETAIGETEETATGETVVISCNSHKL